MRAKEIVESFRERPKMENQAMTQNELAIQLRALRMREERSMTPNECSVKRRRIYETTHERASRLRYERLEEK